MQDESWSLLPCHPKHVQEKPAVDCLHAERHRRQSPERTAQRGLSIKSALVNSVPPIKEPEPQSHAGEKQRAPELQAAFDVEIAKQALAERAFGKDSAICSVDSGVGPHPEHLITQQHKERSEQHRMRVQDDAA